MPLADFIAQGQALLDDATIHALCEREIAELYDTYQDTTVHKMVSKYRNAIRDHKLDPAFLVHMHERKEAVDTMRSTYAQAIGLRHRQQYPIVNVDDLVAIAQGCLTSQSYTRVIVGLELVTGRRPYELACTAQCTPAETHAVWFQGQAKTRGTVPTDHRYLIPTLITAEDICIALDRLHHLRNFAGYTSQRFDDTAGKTLRETRRTVFQKLLPAGALEVKEALRKIYACIAYDWFARADISYNAYIADILGHGPHDVNTANSYQDFYLAMVP